MVVEGSHISQGSNSQETVESEITFSGKDVDGIHPHDNNPMVITMRSDDW